MSEIVTKALLRLVRVPGLDRPAALITLDNGLDHTKPNTLGRQGLSALASAIDEALATEPAFIAVTGKPYIFCVGADLTSAAPASRDAALELGRRGHAVFAALRDSMVPTFAFVNGAAMGGGLELALHCHYRTLSGGAAAIALPEVSLGLVPAWGGTQLLPNLIGIVPAAQVIVQNPLTQNRMLRPAQAAEMGIADVLFEPADFLERSLEWAAAVVRGSVVVRRPEVDRSQMWDAVLAFARQQLDERLHGAAPAPYRAVELLALAKDASFVDGTAAEDEALADLVFTPQLRNAMYAFDLVQRRAKRPVGAPAAGLARDVTKVGIVGAGLMASQLALLFARRLQVPVVLSDLDQSRVDAGLSYVHSELDKLVAKGRLNAGASATVRALVSGSVDKATAFAGADLVLEAVFEDLDVKRKVWAEVEAVVRPDCVLATNTSSLSVTAMSAALAHPERVVGMHFFNPVALMPLLEIVRTPHTDDPSLATAFAVGKALRKSCVLVKDTPAFVVNRVLQRFLGEVFATVDEGTPLSVADTALDPLGLPIRPMALLELVGPAVALHVARVMNAAYPDRFPVSANLARLVSTGGTDSFVLGSHASTADEVRERALGALGDEIRRMLDEGVVADAADIDLCMILGAGWPFHLGGITPYLNQRGQ